MKLSLFILLTFSLFFSACSQKRITVSSLHPGVIDKKYHTIKLSNFLNDNINQKAYLEEKLANKVINGQKIFNISYDNNTDVILRGEVLESSINYFLYYDERIDYNRCKRYKDIKKNKKRVCKEYRIIRIPCEQRDYKVATKIDMLNPQNNSLIFSKIYTSTHNKDVCFRNYSRHGHFFHSNLPKDKYEINSMLAKRISNQIIEDISPHYAYFNVELMTSLDDERIKYNDLLEDEFDLIIELLLEGHIKKAKEKLQKFDARSVEALYNLALVYEYENKLEDANSLYKQAYKMTNNNDYLSLITQAINRTQINLEEKIKAKSLLP